MDRAEEVRLIEQVVDRLGDSYPHVPPSAVEAIVGSVHRRFDQARIRDFIPLFVERQTREKLEAIGTGELV